MSDTQRLNLEKTAEFLLSHDDYLILTHAMPDGDTLGSAYALCAGLISLGKNAKVVCSDSLPRQYSYFTDAVEFPEFEYKTVISCDVADKKLLGKLEPLADSVELAIDHHISHRAFAKRLYLDGTAAAACECIYDILFKMQLQLNDTMVAALYTGIATDTGCFKFSNTTPKTHVIAAELMSRNLDFAEINRVMFDTKSRGRMEIEKKALGKVKLYFDNRCAFMAVTDKMKLDSGCTDADLEGITAIPRSIEGVLIGVTLRQKGKLLWKVSMRSYPPYDVSAICGKMNGGGHKFAAGCELSGTLSQVKKEILKHIKQALEETGAGNNTDK